MKNLYVISGVTGMTGSELSRQFVSQGHTVIGFDNFFASSIDTVKDIIDNPSFIFYNYDINKVAQMDEVCDKAKELKIECDGRLVFINCAAVVHTKHFYEVESTFQTNVLAMKEGTFVHLRVFKKGYGMAFKQIINDMRDNVLCKTLVPAIYISKANRTTFNSSLANSIFHKEFSHQLAASITCTLAMFRC